MAAGLNPDEGAIIYLRTDVVFPVCSLCQSGQNVDAGKATGDLLHLWGPVGSACAQFQKELAFQFVKAFLGAQHLGFILF